MTQPTAADRDSVVPVDEETSKTSVTKARRTMRKKPLADVANEDAPEISVAAGDLRGTGGRTGIRISAMAKESVVEELVEDPVVSAKNEKVVPFTPESVADTAEVAPVLAAIRPEDEESFLLKSNDLPELELPKWVGHARQVAMGVSLAWGVLCAIYLVMGLGLGKLFSMPLDETGGLIAGLLAPVAVLWLTLTHLMRTHDAQRYGEALRAELHALIFPSEERQQRISYDIERLCKQAAELSMSSRTVLRAIQKSRQGMQEESKSFTELARKTEFHIDQLAEGLSQRSSKLLALADELETRVSTIDERALAGVEAWDEVTSSIIEKANDIEKTLGRGADKIVVAAEQARDKTSDIENHLNDTIDNLGGSIDRVAERLTTLSTEFDSHGENLSRATDRVVDETGRLGRIIEGQISDLEGMTSGVIEAISKSSQVVKDQRQVLEEGAQEISRQADGIAERIRGSASALYDAAGSIVTRVEEVESRLGRQSDGLRSLIVELSSQTNSVEQTGLALSNRLSEALSVALSGSETLSAAVRRAVESLDQAAGNARDQANEIVHATQSTVEQLHGASGDQLERMQVIVRQLGDSREQLLESARKAEEQAQAVLRLYEEQTASVGVAVTTLTEKVSNIGDHLDKPLRAIDAAVAETDRRHQMIDQTLQRRVDDLMKSSDKAHETAEQIQGMLRTQAQDMSVLSGQIAGHVRTIGEQLVSQKDDLSHQAEKLMADLEGARGAIERNATSLRTLAGDMTGDLTRIHTTIAEKSQALRQESDETLARLESVDLRLEESVDQLESRTLQLKESLESATEALDNSAEKSEPLYRRTLEQTHAAQDRLEQLNRSFDTTANSNLERLQQIGVIFDDRLTQLRQGAQEASQVLRTTGDELRGRIDDLDHAANTSREQMGGVSTHIQSQISDIHLITDQAVLKVDAIQKAIENQFTELNAAVGKAVVELESAHARFLDSTKTVDGATDASVRRLQAAARETAGETEVLQNAAAAVVKGTQDMMSSLQSEAKTLLHAATESLLEMKKMGDTFALRAREVEDFMKSSLTASQTYGRDLKSQATVIADASVEAADKVSRVVVQLGGKVQEIEKAADSVGDRVEQVRGRLDSEAGKFISTAKQAVEAAEEASSAYVRQSNVLFKAAQDAAAQVEKIRDVHGKTQRDTFLSSAKFVIESLHSLSVDFVRVLEGEVQDKSWKAFQKGDVSVFTRRLVQVADQLPQDKIRAKFTTDSEFRNYVQRYIRLFEDLFDQAQANDHGELLVATFLSSDVGKLYQVLCSATGRDAKAGKDLGTRAAA